ncbi:dUTPase [Yersinia phage fHe-Yen9-02]|nr:dUTPase [Yersinia phage fHe-Yen9-02]
MSFKIVPDLAMYPDFITPKRGSAYSAGIDVFAQQDVRVTKNSTMINLGFKASIPAGYGAFLLPRSGYGSKYGLALSNTIGLLDPDYRGYWMASVWLNGAGSKIDSLTQDQLKFKQCLKLRMDNGETLTQEDYETYLRDTFLLIPRGEAIGQLVFMRTEQWEAEIVTELDATVRGEGGFGSTNKVKH